MITYIDIYKNIYIYLLIEYIYNRFELGDTAQISEQQERLRTQLGHRAEITGL